MGLTAIPGSAPLAPARRGAAVLSHLFVLGIAIQGDGGLLFGLAIVVTVASLVALAIHRADLPLIAKSTVA